ncbi:MAG: hypothetical protein HQK50_02175 [Oligoflexia bacterium]|nr:hypothetical protein [Oligoflexia bacterium]MBF0364346.1 hypothetical protein [Oligoflexia bacterium]
MIKKILLTLILFLMVINLSFALTAKTKLTNSLVTISDTIALQLLPDDRWVYAEVDRFKYPVKMLQNKIYPEIMGVISKSIEVVGENQKIDVEELLEQRCEMIKSGYENLSLKHKEFKSQVVFFKAKAAVPVCILTLFNGAYSKKTIYLISKRSGESAAYSYDFHNFIFKYPLKFSAKVDQEIEKLLLGIQSQSRSKVVERL